MTTQDTVRIGSYLSVLILMALWELIAPRRPLTVSKLRRWGGNLTIVALNTMIARLLFMGGAVSVAVAIQEWGWGLLHCIKDRCGLRRPWQSSRSILSSTGNIVSS